MHVLLVSALTALLLAPAAASVCKGDTSSNCAQEEQKACPGDTRGKRGTVKCNHDPTHRVCAIIGDPDTSFWTFTGQSKWCGKDLYGSGEKACPYTKGDATDDGSWCICKWATARWIKGVWPSTTNPVKCPASIEINCDASDICNTHQGLFFSYNDFGVDLKPAHECVKQKCKTIWDKCVSANNKAAPLKEKRKSIASGDSRKSEARDAHSGYATTACDDTVKCDSTPKDLDTSKVCKAEPCVNAAEDQGRCCVKDRTVNQAKTSVKPEKKPNVAMAHSPDASSAHLPMASTGFTVGLLAVAVAGLY